MKAFYEARTKIEGVPDPFHVPERRDPLTSAMELHRRGLSYPAISEVIDLYHGLKLGPDAWRVRCRANGAPGRSRPGSFGSRT